MKKILLAALMIAPFLMVAQNIKKQKVKSSYLAYPKIDVSNMDITTLKVDFCAGDTKFAGKSVKKTTNACKAKGGSIKDAKAIEVFYYQIIEVTGASYLKISDASGNIKYMEQTAEAKKGSVDFGKKKCYWAQPVLESAYKKEKASFESKSKSANDKSALNSARKFLNGALFFTYVPQELQVFYVKSKDHDYSDLSKAAEIAKTGYDAITDNTESKDAKSRLTQAVVIWEKALAESTPDNKKSRVNKKVTLHISENLGNAYLYLLNFDKAQKVVGNALALEKNVTNNGTIRRKALLAAIVENKKGYELNKNTPINQSTAKVDIKSYPPSESASFAADYKKYGNAALASDIAASKEEYKEAVASGEINPYQKYVVAITGGDMLTLPDLASKLAKAPAGDKLDEFPEAITELNLATLILRGNNLKSIPPSIGKMTSLKKLVLVNNQLTSLPDEIGNLKNLKTLNIKGNNIPAADVSKIQALLPNCKIKQ